MFHIKPNYPGVINALTGQPIPLDGITREVLLPPDHVAERSGDVVITPLDAPAEVSAQKNVDIPSDAATKASKTKP